MITSRLQAGKVVLILLFAIVIIIGLAGKLKAQEHSHPPQDAQLHERFYQGWMRPDAPDKSCCNKQDCYPTEARVVAGRWLAKRREDGKWLTVPASKIERRREMPVGAHLCAPPPLTESAYEGGVICFGSGSGT